MLDRCMPQAVKDGKVPAIAAGHYAFLAKSDSPLYLAGDRPNGDPADVNEIFPGESAIKGKPYVLKRVDFGVPALRLSGGGASPTVPAPPRRRTRNSASRRGTRSRPRSGRGAT